MLSFKKGSNYFRVLVICSLPLLINVKFNNGNRSFPTRDHFSPAIKSRPIEFYSIKSDKNYRLKVD